jgi:energy-coupling factor transporter ATP-binding protein EcfA2
MTYSCSDNSDSHHQHLPAPPPADADVYLLDDPLSAVDAHVGRQLLDECITGLLAGKTRVLVTHQLQVLPSADLVLVMVEGRITHRGTHQVGEGGCTCTCTSGRQLSSHLLCVASDHWAAH